MHIIWNAVLCALMLNVYAVSHAHAVSKNLTSTCMSSYFLEHRDNILSRQCMCMPTQYFKIRYTHACPVALERSSAAFAPCLVMQLLQTVCP